MAVLYDKGIVVLPKSVYSAAGFRKGTKLSIRSEGKKVIIESVEDALEDFRDLCKNAKLSGKEVEKQIKAAEAEMEAEALHVP